MVEAGESTAHLHIGPGCLGLGLVVAAGLEADLDVHLIAREASALPDSARFKALRKGSDGEAVIPLPISTLSKADTAEALPGEVRELTFNVPELLVTIAATTPGLEQRQAFLLTLAEARAASASASSTVFIPCENDPGKCYPELKAKLEGLGVECRDTMVNRLCPDLRLDPADGSFEVVVDEMAEWVIQGEADHQLALRALDGLAYVEFAPDVAPFETRKRWLVNGAHLALAILARARNIASIDIAAAAAGRTRWLEKLHRALIEALDRQHPGMRENDGYAASHVAAWARHEDRVMRILRRLRRAEPLPFFDDLERKLIEPLEMLEDLSRFPQVGDVLDRLHYVLLKGESYVDYGDFEDFLPSLATSVDVRMCSRYRQLLEPVLGGDEARARAESLGMALESHREELKAF